MTRDTHKPVPGREYTLRLQPLPRSDDPQGIRRIRRALKWLLRSCGLRCTAISPNLPTEEHGDADDSNRFKKRG